MSSVAWTTTLYLGSPATGMIWSFVPTPNSTDSRAINAVQPIPSHERSSAKPIVFSMLFLLLLQLLFTLFCYGSICYTSYMSTMSVVLKQGTDNNGPNKCKPQTTKRNVRKDKLRLSTSFDSVSTIGPKAAYSLPNLQIIKSVSPISTKPDVKETRRSGSAIERCSKTVMENYDDSSYKNSLIIKHNRDSGVKKLSLGPTLQQFGLSTHSQTQNLTAKITLHDQILKVDSNVTKHSDPINCSRLDSNTRLFHQRNQMITTPDEKVHKSRKNKRKSIFPTADSYSSDNAISGACTVNIPLTNLVFCVTRKDIICTAGLTSQIICLCITHALLFYTFKISGQKVSSERYISAIYSLEAAFILNTIVDPIICIIFSSKYRNAAKDILFK